MGVFFDRLKLCSTAALDYQTGQNKGRYRKKELLFLLKLEYVSLKITMLRTYLNPIYLYLIFEICISRNLFLNLIFEFDFLSISNLFFTACVACKNQVQNRQKIKLKNQFRELEILKNQVQIHR
jgi:hypothetical protein